LTTNTQDLREMGGLASRMPATTSGFVVGALGSVGLVPLGCFWAMHQWAYAIWPLSNPLFIVLLLVNGLTSFSLTRIFGLVFCGSPQEKTRRAPEVPWLLALPMVFLTVATLLVPAMLIRWQLLPAVSEINWAIAGLLVTSSAIGCGLGSVFYLGTRSPQPEGASWLSLRELLAQDFRIEQLYRLTVVLAVTQGSRLTAWFDRYIVDGMVNLLGIVSLMGGESLKYTISGQSRHYLLTLFVGVFLGIAWLGWML